MRKENLIRLLTLLFAFVPTNARARVIVLDTTVHTSITQLTAGFINVILQWSGVIAAGLFLLGSVFMVGSGGSDQLLSSGKRIMKASIIGFAIVLASWMIMSTVVYFIAG